MRKKILRKTYRICKWQIYKKNKIRESKRTNYIRIKKNNKKKKKVKNE